MNYKPYPLWSRLIVSGDVKGFQKWQRERENEGGERQSEDEAAERQTKGDERSESEVAHDDRIGSPLLLLVCVIARQKEGRRSGEKGKNQREAAATKRSGGAGAVAERNEMLRCILQRPIDVNSLLDATVAAVSLQQFLLAYLLVQTLLIDNGDVVATLKVVFDHVEFVDYCESNDLLAFLGLFLSQESEVLQVLHKEGNQKRGWWKEYREHIDKISLFCRGEKILRNLERERPLYCY